jgi:choline monooxygenase
MFLSTTHAPQLLEPHRYGCPKQHALELERLFRPGWQFVGTLADIPRTGDYLTFELHGEPVLLRNIGGQAQAFLNVCSHRFCTLSSKAKGNDPHFRCQYHGWEYDADGNTRKIPDAPSFRPLEKGKLGLIKFRTESCGQLIFVSLSDDGPSLRAHLGEHYDRLTAACAPGRPQILSKLYDTAANWKVPVENSLESYHLDMIHSKSFGTMPEAAVCEHELTGNGSTFRAPGGPKGLMGDFFCHVMRKLGLEPTRQYTHTLVFPNLMYYTQDLTIGIQTCIPVSPTTSRMVWNWFATTTDKPLWNRMAVLLNQAQLSLFRTVVAEDVAVYPKAQQGLSSPRHPKGGLLATREERLRHFQEYIEARCPAGATASSTASAEAHCPPTTASTPACGASGCSESAAPSCAGDPAVRA